MKTKKVDLLCTYISVLIVTSLVGLYVFGMLAKSYFSTDNSFMGKVIYHILTLFGTSAEQAYQFLVVPTWVYIISASVTLLLIIVFVFIHKSEISKSFFDFCFNKRFIIAVLILALYVACDFNGTSLGWWSSILGTDSNIIFGVPRGVRSDEFGTWSPYAFSQFFINWGEVNTVLEGGIGVSTIWESIGGIPAVNIAMPFKPFYLGFIVFGLSRGFSFLWGCRAVFSVLVSFELALHYTNENRKLSLAAACLISFAPTVQWFYSQSIAEVLIFMQAMILCVIYIIKNSNNKRRCFLYSCLLAWMLGCLIMIGYPSWVIQAIYIFLAYTVVLIVESKPRFTDVIKLIIPSVISVVYILFIVWLDKGTLLDVANSIYPGNRVSNINGVGLYQISSSSPGIVSGLYSIFLPFIDAPATSQSEFASFISFAPMGLILSVYNRCALHRKDNLSLSMMGWELLCYIYIIVGLPSVFAKLTLLSQLSRLHIFIGVADTILLIRNISIFENSKQRISKMFSAFISALLSIAICFFQSRCFEINFMLIVICALLYFIVFYLILAVPNKIVFTYVVICISLLSGLFVNPVQQGVDCITDSEFITMIRETGSNDDVYLIESVYPVTNITLFAGKKAFNTTQVYPNIDRWDAIDPDKEYSDCYNRFCHNCLYITDEETSFTVIQSDYIQINLNINDIEKTKANYLLTQKDYDEFELVNSWKDWKIYTLGK